MSTIINGTSSAITFPDSTVQNTAFTTGAVTQSNIGTGVAGTGPAFSAYQSSAQTLSSATFTKILFQTEEFDTNNNFASSTFTPTVAGYYQINGGISVSAAVCSILLAVAKNGVSNKYLFQTNTTVASAFGSCLIYCNGTTDYIDLYAQVSVGQALSASYPYTYFQASLVRAA